MIEYLSMSGILACLTVIWFCIAVAIAPEVDKYSTVAALIIGILVGGFIGPLLKVFIN